MAELIITVRTHHFLVTNVTPSTREAVESFAKRYVQYGFERSAGRTVYKGLRAFAASTDNRLEYRFHINTLSDFKEHLRLRFLEKSVIFQTEPLFETEKASFTIKPEWEDRDYQLPIIEYMVSPEAPLSKCVGMQTGKGKSYCTMRAMALLALRTMLIIRPMYIDKWLIDFSKTYDIPPEDILTVSGADELMGLIDLAITGRLTARVIILSNKTFQNFIKLYETHYRDILEMGYGCTPDDFFETLKVGIRVIDEVHQDFHLQFKIDLYTHVEKSISLSASMVPDDAFLVTMYETAYPAVGRHMGPAYDKYIAATAAIYRFNNPDRIRTRMFGSKTYSHHALEQSILKSKEMTNNYFELINDLILGSYIKDYKSNQRLIIFCASIECCTLLTKFLQRRYPDMDVRRYVEEDPYENLMVADIRVTTLQSAGTAVDVPGLSTTILTPAVRSTQSNVQGFGRLRPLKDGSIPHFIYLVSESIAKHLEYHESKKEILRDRALTYRCIRMPRGV